MDRFPSYHPRDYPTGVSDFLSTFPPERRNEVLAAIIELHNQGKREEKWVARQIWGMLELPNIIYKYVPLESLDLSLPTTLRATQPAALNDVMEGNIATSMQGKMDRDMWYAIVSDRVKSIFSEDAFSDEELERRKRFGDPRVSTIIRDYLSRQIGVVSFSVDPLIPTMWAHYAGNSGFVVGYKTSEIRECGIDLRRVLYLELAPTYTPTLDNIVRLNFVDEERRQREPQVKGKKSGTPILGSSVDFLELRRDLGELAKILFIKSKTWENEKEIRLLIDLQNTRKLEKRDKNGFSIHLFDVPTEFIAEVYVGFNTPRQKVATIEDMVGVGEGSWKLIHTDSHAYRMQTPSTSIRHRKKLVDRHSC